ncbi:Uncharacterised protein [Mycobacteroides abscessus subsp. abscessus]|nr:Uncharacterised protein [Mycobacteroides abscessus subsp. abscessus]
MQTSRPSMVPKPVTTPSPSGRLDSRPKLVLRWRASASSSTNEPSSSSAKMRSRAVSLPLAWILSTAASPTGCSASSLRRRRSASLPAVVCMSGWGAAASAAVWLSDSVVVMGPDAIARHPAEHAWALESSQKFSRRDVHRSR